MWRRTLLAVPMAVFVLMALGNAFTHIPWCDEGAIAGPAFNLITHGRMASTILEPTAHTFVRRSNNGSGAVSPARLDQHAYWMPPLDFIAQAGWYEVFGFSVFSMRALSIAWGLVALASWVWIVEALSKDQTLGLVTLCFLAVDGTLITTASDGRMDMMSAALGFAALASYLKLRERNLSAGIVASQALAVASGLTHPLGGCLAFIALLVLTLYMDRERLRPRHIFLAMIPYVVGAVGWGLYILQDPRDFLTQFNSNAFARFQRSYFTPWGIIWREIKVRYLSAFGLGSGSAGLARLKIFVLAAYVVGTLGAICSKDVRRQKGLRMLLILAGIYLVGLMVVDSSKKDHYLIYGVAPLCVAWSLWIYRSWMNRSLPRPLIILAVSGFACLQIGRTLQRIAENQYRKTYAPAVAFLKSNVPKGSFVMGGCELGFGLGFDADLSDDPTLGYYTGKKPDFIAFRTSSSGYRCDDWDLSEEATFRGSGKDESKVYQHVTKMLTQDYQKLYSDGFYQVYSRR